MPENAQPLEISMLGNVSHSSLVAIAFSKALILACKIQNIEVMLGRRKGEAELAQEALLTAKAGILPVLYKAWRFQFEGAQQAARGLGLPARTRSPLPSCHFQSHPATADDLCMVQSLPSTRPARPMHKM